MAVVLDGDDVVAEALELEGRGRTEASEPHDDHVLLEEAVLGQQVLQRSELHPSCPWTVPAR